MNTLYDKDEYPRIMNCAYKPYFVKGIKEYEMLEKRNILLRVFYIKTATFSFGMWPGAI